MAKSEDGQYELVLENRQVLVIFLFAEAEEDPAKHRGEKKDHQHLPVLQDQLVLSVFALGHMWLFAYDAFILSAFILSKMPWIKSSGSGKTMVVFFSTPISVRVCK